MNNIVTQAINRVLGLFGGVRDKASEQINQMTRQSRIARAIYYYYGLVPPQLKVKAGEPDDNVYINYAEVIVDKGVAFLFGKALKISVGSDEDKRGEGYLEKVWSQAQRDEEFQEMAQDGATSGDAYLKINIEPSGSPRVTVGDPNTYELITDPHDCSRVIKFLCSYPVAIEGGKTKLFREETARSEDGKSWSIRQFESYNDGGSWQSVGVDVTWNFSFPPIFHCKNLPQPKSIYGKADLTEPVLNLIAYISRLDSMCGKIVRIHSSPKPYAKNLKKQDLEWGTDGMLFLKPQGGGGTLQVDAEIGLLEMQNDISTALSLRKVLREGLAEMTGVPEVATGKLENVGQLAGVALRIMYGPLIEKTEKKQLRYGRMIKECVQALLVIGSLANLVVTLHWTDPLPGDEKEKVEVAQAKLAVGFSEDTVIKELGGDPVEERQKKQLTAPARETSTPDLQPVVA
jgi:hypothetical protein